MAFCCFPGERSVCVLVAASREKRYKRVRGSIIHFSIGSEEAEWLNRITRWSDASGWLRCGTCVEKGDLVR